jgi:ectoine hydroxylase-related dioxygenase (phytanoyl-CoA dioxygenase family)
MIDDSTIEAFARDGVVVVRGALSRDELEVLERGVDYIIAHPSERVKVASGADDPGRFVEDFVRWAEVPEVEEIALRSKLPETAAALMDSTSARFYHDHMLVKEPGTCQRTPWHQDQPYYNVDGTGVSAWVPLDEIPRRGSMEFWAGSHRGPWRLPRAFLDAEAKWFPEGSLAEMPDIDADRSAYDIRQWQLSPGDAVFFNFLTVHCAPGFPFEHRRRVMSFRYLSADARHAVRPWKTSPEFPGLADELDDGLPFDHPNFPLAWPRSKASVG